MSTQKSDSFIVEFWSRVFFVLRKVSLFSLVSAVFPQLITYRFVDFWVLGHTILSFAALVVLGLCPNTILGWPIVAYGVIRVFEIDVYQVNVLLFGEYRAKRAGIPYALGGYRRLVLLLLHNYVEIIFWFSCSYLFFADHFYRNAGGRTVFDAFHDSFVAMSTFGNLNLSPNTAVGTAILLFQAATGLFMTLLTLARFIGMLPRPASQDETD